MTSARRLGLVSVRMLGTVNNREPNHMGPGYDHRLPQLRRLAGWRCHGSSDWVKYD
jgi:hypothetical protein